MEVEWTDHEGWLRISTALLEDISAIGGCLQMEVSLPMETKVELRYRGAILSAVVRYCVYREIGYYVGIEFREGFEWSQQDFQPRHLLDLTKIKGR